MKARSEYRYHVVHCREGWRLTRWGSYRPNVGPVKLGIYPDELSAVAAGMLARAGAPLYIHAENGQIVYTHE